MSKIDIDKFIVSLMNDGSGINPNLYTNMQDALRDQGFEFDEGNLIPTRFKSIIDSAKSGDIFVVNSIVDRGVEYIFLFERYDKNEDTVYAYCWLVYYNSTKEYAFDHGHVSICHASNSYIRIATKQEKDLLFKYMKDNDFVLLMTMKI